MRKDKKIEPAKIEVKEVKEIPEFNEVNLLMHMKNAGGKDLTSTMIRDHFDLSKESGRGQARRLLKKLAKDGKVKIHLKEDVKRRQYLYDVAIDNPNRDRQNKKK